MIDIIISLLKEWLRIFRGVTIDTNMAILVTSVTAILTTLNGTGNIGPWVEDKNYYVLQNANLTQNIITPLSSSNIGLKIFFNSKTGEIKFYVAKWIDEYASALLP